MSYLDELNEPQRTAVLHKEGPLMIIAGAGSGKTKTLTCRIASLIEQGNDPFSILALTFTNKAAKEMKERISLMVGAEARNIWMGTFHSVFSKVLRVEAERLGYSRAFSIYDTDDAKRLLTAVVKGLNLDNKAYSANNMYNRISSAKNSLIGPESYANNPEIKAADRAARKEHTATVYAAYQQRLHAANAMDFDDLLFNMNVLLRDFPEVLLKYQQKFRHILVDEYQDTNFSQYLIVKKLAARHENLCVVGDDAQSIYAFRGANITNILNFERDYPSVCTIKLEQNYRSTQTIVSAANHVIKNNQEQIHKEIWTANEVGKRIELIKTASENEEGRLIAKKIKEIMLRERLQYKDFAVLYRTNNQSRSIEEGLRVENIPYRVFSGHAFYSRKEIKDVMAYFRLVANNNDNEAFLRIVNYPARGIGQTSLDRLDVYAKEHQIPLFNLALACTQHPIDLHSGIKQKLETFALMIRSLSHKILNTEAFPLAEEIVARSGIIAHLKEEENSENMSRVENIGELLNAVREYMDQDDNILDELTGEISTNTAKTLDLFLQQSTLLTDADSKKTTDTNYVSLMTIHSAKGLEFDCVHLAGVEENLFPSYMSLASRPELEEERRLFYVAVTRARKHLTLSYTELRYRYGESTLAEPSRFIDELGEEYVDYPQVASSVLDKRSPAFIVRKQAAKKPAIPTLPPNAAALQAPLLDIADITEGLSVYHDKFGSGTVQRIEGTAENTKAWIHFAAFGEKQLLLRFAKLKKI